MLFKSTTLVLIGLLGANVSAENMGMSLRKVNDKAEAETAAVAREEESFEGEVLHLDLEVIVEGGERKLFPLLPGTLCPTGHTCRVRNQSHAGASPMISALKKNFRTPLAISMDWNEFNNNLKTVVASDNYCTRRTAMARAAGLAAGVAATTVSQPAYAAETKEVKMGTDNGGLQFVPANTKICKGDSVKWYVEL